MRHREQLHRNLVRNPRARGGCRLEAQLLKSATHPTVLLYLLVKKLSDEKKDMLKGTSYMTN